MSACFFAGECYNQKQEAPMTTTNYHSHHQLCNHAEGTAQDYVKKAIDLGFDAIGISDHVPSDLLPDSMRMRFDELDGYYSDVLTAQAAFKDDIQVYLGMECEYLDDDPAYYEAFLKQVDYLVLGQHYVQEPTRFHSAFGLHTDDQVRAYGQRVVQALKTGYFSLLAHPDLYMCGLDAFNDTATEVAHQIIQAAQATKTPIEFNANGIRRGIKHTSQGPRYPYPRIEFWNIVKTYEVDVVLSSDAHHPNLLYDDAMKKAEAMMEELNLNRIHHLPMKHRKNRF